MITSRKLTPVAILGSGNIGTDLLLKIQRSEWLECKLFVGRNLSSPGLAKASALGVPVSDKSIDAILNDPDCCEIVFDATSARDHLRHWPLLQKAGKRVIDLTPAKVGKMCIPAVNLEECLAEQNVNMITCGGQASLPLIYLIGQTQKDLEYVEIVSSISSRSAGPATRINIDEYIDTTEAAIRQLLGRRSFESPAHPQPCQSLHRYADNHICEGARTPHQRTGRRQLKPWLPLFALTCPATRSFLDPSLRMAGLSLCVKVQGLGDYLPKYAGNLDIINCAAIAYAEAYAMKSANGSVAQEVHRD